MCVCVCVRGRGGDAKITWQTGKEITFMSLFIDLTQIYSEVCKARIFGLV